MAFRPNPGNTGLRRSVVAITIVIGLIAVGCVVTTTSAQSSELTPAHTAWVPFQSRSTGGYTVVSRTFSSSYEVNYLASEKSSALLNILFPNETSELVLFDAATNSTKVIQPLVPGGNESLAYGMTAAGGAFFLVWLNLTNFKEFWEKVTLSGKVTYPTLPLGSIAIGGIFYPWEFDYGNTTNFFMSAGRDLVEINATSLKLEANYTKSVPANVSVQTVLPIGDRLYLAGSRSLSNGAANSYFGFINLTTKKTTTISKRIAYPCNASTCLEEAFYALAAYGSDIYVGGALANQSETSGNYSYRVIAGSFYEFVPSTAAFTNLTSLLPVKSWGVFALDPWGRTIALSLNSLSENSTEFLIGGGIYSLIAGPSLVNETSVFPKGYVTYTTGDTSVSNGWYFAGGFDLAADIGEVVAVKT